MKPKDIAFNNSTTLKEVGRDDKFIFGNVEQAKYLQNLV